MIKRILKSWREQPFLELYEPALVRTLALMSRLLILIPLVPPTFPLGFVILNPVPPILNLGPRTFMLTTFHCCFGYLHDRENAKKVQDIIFNNPAPSNLGNTSPCVPACRIAGRVSAAEAGRSGVYSCLSFPLLSGGLGS
jgi:hypothetical protein